jgi:hypothetical protein
MALSNRYRETALSLVSTHQDISDPHASKYFDELFTVLFHFQNFSFFIKTIASIAPKHCVTGETMSDITISRPYVVVMPLVLSG